MKIAIISGASSGIGRAISKELDLLSLDELWLIGRNEERLVELKNKLKTRVQLLTLDLSQTNSFDELKLLLSQNSYEVEFLVASAGVGYTGAVETNTQVQISNMIDLNCRGLTLLVSTVLPYISENGKIINLASGAGFLPQADFAVYAASKSYVISFSRALRKELKKRKINVTAVCPGPVDTEFFSNLENVKEYKKKYLISPEKVAKCAIRAVIKNKAICTTSFSMKLLHLLSKILPTSLLLWFAK